MMPVPPDSGTRSPRGSVAEAVQAILARGAAVATSAPDLARALALPAADVQAKVFGLVLRAALAGTLPSGTGGSPRERLRVAASALRSAAPRAGLATLGAPGSTPLDDLVRATGWLDDATLDRLLAAVAVRPAFVAHDLGRIQEELLELQIRRLDGSSFCLKPRGVWVAAEALLETPPAKRSRFLQRTADLPKSAVHRFAEPLEAARSSDDLADALAPILERSSSDAPAQRLVVDASVARRRSGAHYTPQDLCRTVVEKALTPLVRGRSSDAILDLRVCDPAMGSGVFLAEAARVLAAELERARAREGRPVSQDGALGAVVSRCLYGVDRDPVAVDLARWSLLMLTGDPRDTTFLARHLVSGDALVGRSSPSTPPSATPPSATVTSGFDWPERFPVVFARSSPGFDACIGNPPWVAYVGRAAQPLAPELFRHYAAENPAFRRYRTLHGLFVRRGAELLRGGGRLGLVLPTSVADLAGYAPTREAHDELAEPDDELLDFGDGAFDGVFQPCMALTSTRRHDSASPPGGRPWRLARGDLAPEAEVLLSRLAELPPLDARLFGERGFQTTADDLSHLSRLPAAPGPFAVPIHEGSDVTEMVLAPPSAFLEPKGLRGKLRGPEEWKGVAVLIRQTARYPIAALSDGLAFRNSILAGFTSPDWTAFALAAYLNSSLVRWYHYTRHRDARQGMPQLKIGHLRALPDVRSSEARQELHTLGQLLHARSAGIDDAARQALDRAVFGAHGLTEPERRLVRDWAIANPPPRSRRQ